MNFHRLIYLHKDCVTSTQIKKKLNQLSGILPHGSLPVITLILTPAPR